MSTFVIAFLKKTSIDLKLLIRQLHLILRLSVSAARSTAELAAYYDNRPVMSWYAPSLMLTNKTMFPTLVRTFPPVNKVVDPLIKLFDLYSYTNIGKFIMTIDCGRCCAHLNTEQLV